MNSPPKSGVLSFHRPRRHSNTIIVKNFVQKILGVTVPSMTAEEIRKQGAELSVKLSA